MVIGIGFAVMAILAVVLYFALGAMKGLSVCVFCGSSRTFFVKSFAQDEPAGVTGGANDDKCVVFFEQDTVTCKSCGKTNDKGTIEEHLHVSFYKGEMYSACRFMTPLEVLTLIEGLMSKCDASSYTLQDTDACLRYVFGETIIIVYKNMQKTEKAIYTNNEVLRMLGENAKR